MVGPTGAVPELYWCRTGTVLGPFRACTTVVSKLYRVCTCELYRGCAGAMPSNCAGAAPVLHRGSTRGGTGLVLGYHQGSSGAVPRQKELNCTGAVPACTGAAPGWYQVYRGNTCDLQRLSVARGRNLPFPLYMAVSSLPPCVCSTCFCACTRLMSAIVSCCACGCRVLACFSAVPLALSLAVLLRLLPL